MRVRYEWRSGRVDEIIDDWEKREMRSNRESIPPSRGSRGIVAMAMRPGASTGCCSQWRRAYLRGGPSRKNCAKEAS